MLLATLRITAYRLGWEMPDVKPVEVFVARDGRIAFPEDYQSPEFLEKFIADEVDDMPYTDFEALRERFKELGISRPWESPKRETGGIQIAIVDASSGLSGTDLPDESRYVFINAHPEAKHRDVANVMNCATMSGLWYMTLGTTTVGEREVPLAVSRPAPCSGRSWWNDEEEEYPDSEDWDRQKPKKTMPIWRDVGDDGKGIVIAISADSYVIADKKHSLAEVESILVWTLAPPEKTGVCIMCAGNSQHRSLIALLQVCAKHGIPSGKIYLFSM